MLALPAIAGAREQATGRPAASTPNFEPELSSLSYIRWRNQQQQRLVDIGFRIGRAASGECVEARPGLSIIIGQANQFAPADRAVTGFGEPDSRPRLVAVANGSPAAAAGLATGDILALWPAGSPIKGSAPTFAGIDRAVDLLEERLRAARADQREQSAMVILPVVRQGVLHVFAVSVESGCGAWFDLAQSGKANATSNARWIQVSDALMTLLSEDDDGLAFVIGHEMGHRVLRSRPGGGNAECRKACELEADRLGLVFMQRAGFSPARAPAALLAVAAGHRGFLDGRGRSLRERAARLTLLVERGMAGSPHLLQNLAADTKSHK